jgi:hypothetical protein
VTHIAPCEILTVRCAVPYLRAPGRAAYIALEDAGPLRGEEVVIRTPACIARCVMPHSQGFKVNKSIALEDVGCWLKRAEKGGLAARAAERGGAGGGLWLGQLAYSAEASFTHRQPSAHAAGASCAPIIAGLSI